MRNLPALIQAGLNWKLNICRPYGRPSLQGAEYHRDVVVWPAAWLPGGQEKPEPALLWMKLDLIIIAALSLVIISSPF